MISSTTGACGGWCAGIEPGGEIPFDDVDGHKDPAFREAKGQDAVDPAEPPAAPPAPTAKQNADSLDDAGLGAPIAAMQDIDPFETGIPVAPKTGPSTPVLAGVTEPGGEVRTRTWMKKPAVIKIYDQYEKLVRDGDYTLTEEIIDVKRSPEVSAKQAITASSTLDKDITDNHELRPSNGYKEFTDGLLYIRRQILRVESDNMEPRVVGYFLLKTTIQGTEIINCTRGCTKAQLGTEDK